MKKQEIKFTKYKMARDYHYREINARRLLSFNLFLYTRYVLVVDEIEKYLLKKSAPNQKIRILDVGCGDGVLLYLLQKHIMRHVVEMHGVDLSPEALGVAEEKIPQGIFTRKDAYHTGYPDRYFDIVVSSDVIEHLQKPQQMLCEISRIAGRQALVIIGTPVRFTENPAPPHVHEFFPGEFKELIDKYLQKTKLVQSHPLSWLLFYTMPMRVGKHNFTPGQYLCNFLYLLLRLNPFMQDSRQIKKKFSYMYAAGFNK